MPKNFICVELPSGGQDYFPKSFFSKNKKLKLSIKIINLKPGDLIIYTGNRNKKCKTLKPHEMKANQFLNKGEKYKFVKAGSTGKEIIFHPTN